MAYTANEQVSSNSRAAAPRFFPESIAPKTFGNVAAAPLLAQLTPLVKSTADSQWYQWTQGTDEVNTISISSTVSGGTFTITAGGQTTTALAFNATAATIQAALEALSNVVAGDVVVTGGPVATADVILTWGGLFSGTAIVVTLDDASITGGGSVDVAETTAGVGAANDLNVIKGFVADVEGVQVHATGEVLGNVLLAGDIHRDDVVLPTGETQSQLDTALATTALRSLGFTVQGLANVG